MSTRCLSKHEQNSQVIYGVAHIYCRRMNLEGTCKQINHFNLIKLISHFKTEAWAQAQPSPSPAWPSAQGWAWDLASPSPLKPSPSPGFEPKPGPAHHYWHEQVIFLHPPHLLAPISTLIVPPYTAWTPLCKLYGHSW
jgi:hypothetical protein